MELKQYYAGMLNKVAALLIVPYGIETVYWWFLGRYPNELLIVPYGIETHRNYGHHQQIRTF